MYMFLNNRLKINFSNKDQIKMYINDLNNNFLIISFNKFFFIKDVLFFRSYLKTILVTISHEGLLKVTFYCTYQICHKITINKSYETG